MLEHVKAPVKAIVGAWYHTWPHEPYPKPGMEWRHEAVRWFDHWLKGEDTGIMDEPRFAVYVRDWHPPGPYLENAPGQLALRGRLADRAHPRAARCIRSTTTRSRRSAPAAATHQLRYVPIDRASRPAGP